MPRTLAEARADARGIADQLEAHRKDCAICGDKRKGRRMCETGTGLAAELADARKLVRTWFDPRPDQGTLDMSPAAAVARAISLHHQSCPVCRRGGVLVAGPGGLRRAQCEVEAGLFRQLDAAREDR